MHKKHWIAAGMRSESIDQRYAAVGGFTHGFDYLRLILAVAVVLQHAVVCSDGEAGSLFIWGGWHRIFFAPILLMFFALSGFLVAGSLKRKPTLPAFVTLRAARLLPALTVEVLLSALVLGPWMTRLPWAEYFGHPLFFDYFLNIVGNVHFFLPGVFVDNPFANFVNVSLWTVPLELECYLLLILLWITGTLRRRGWVVVLLLLAVGAGTFHALTHFSLDWANNRPLPRSLVVAFSAGLCLSLFSEKVRLDVRWAALAAAGMLVTTLQYQTVYLAALFSAYLVVYLGMMHPPKRGFLFRGDYSYGLYLFAFPIQQAYAQLFPGYRHWYLNAAFTLVLGLAYAAFSWWVIEKPVLARKRQIVDWVERLIPVGKQKSR